MRLGVYWVWWLCWAGECVCLGYSWSPVAQKEDLAIVTGVPGDKPEGLAPLSRK